MNPVCRRRPQIAIPVEPEPVGKAHRNGMKHIAAAEAVVRPHVKHTNVSFGVFVENHPCVGHIKPVLIGREGEPVGAGKIGQNRLDRTCIRVHPIDLARQLLLRFITFVIRHDPVMRIGEPDRSV